MCKHCRKLREGLSQAHADDSNDDEEDDDAQKEQQYPKLLMSLAPAVRSMFPAVLCGKHAVAGM